MGIGVGVIMTGIQYQKYQGVIRTGLMSVLLPPAYQDVSTSLNVHSTVV